MTTGVWELILAMAVATALPRVLPMLVDLEQWLPPTLVRSLGFVPPAALGALIIPGVFHAADHVALALTALMVATVLALPRRSSLLLTVTVTLLACWGVSLLLV
ncbi:AzlD domain-containing protein [Hydrocarboniclastica marina]|uniref:AzlD domain-containing protein n=1 Tax=Hydrocarboniclastica marina TaxID=2259620 RepID=A0A4P7XLI2_9ALTE|nr:AzlD domain-containing protein [Hydrocarboniclastica marina]MAM00454.1 branched-chain amino acid transporter [Alteromonadaceae bacterium]QCF27713.1 AzlD domain-containing protein [Hydrocarboniclastica marina]|tara:strand:- start:223 stop:534 length:312 start_codon:yes stop_codon:yes gene_type:complete